MSYIKKTIMKDANTGALALLSMAIFLGGCVATSKPLYQWDSYQTQLHEHFKGASPEAQIAALEAQLQRSQTSGATVPPGVHAHLALQYSKVGRTDLMVQQLEAEKALFPESQTFIDRLLAQSRK